VSGEGGRLLEGEDSLDIPAVFDVAGNKGAPSEGLGEEGDDAEDGPDDRLGVCRTLR